MTQAQLAAAFPWIMAFNIVWLAGWITLSVLYRRRQGKPIIPKAPADAIYSERSGSGRSRDNLLGFVGGASNCLLIAVTADELFVSPKFPFNLGFLPEVYGLEHRVPRGSIRSVERKRGILGDGAVIAFDTDKPHKMELRLADAGAFMRALGRG